MDDPIRIPSLSPRPIGIDPQSMRLPAGRAPETGAGSFKDVLQGTISEVQKLQNEADDTIRQLVSGEIKDPTEAMVAIERADVSFQTMMAVRNRIVQAYEEVMRMQV